MVDPKYRPLTERWKERTGLTVTDPDDEPEQKTATKKPPKKEPTKDRIAKILANGKRK